MTYQKTLMTVVIETKSGGSFTVADTKDDSTATAVWGLIRQGSDLLYKDGDAIQYIAHDCICSAKATTTTTEVEKETCEPIDPCAESSDDSGSDSGNDSTEP